MAGIAVYPIDSKHHAAPLASGKEDAIYGMKTCVIDDDVEVHSVSAGLGYPGVDPEHAMFRAVGRSEHRGTTNDEDVLQANLGGQGDKDMESAAEYFDLA